MSTCSMYLDFNVDNNKDDKVFGGIVNCLIIILLMAYASGSFIYDFISDSKPLILNFDVPYTTEAPYERNPKVSLNDLNTIMFRVVESG